MLKNCKYFEGTGNFCAKVTAMRCDEFPECEFKYIEELKAENEKLIEGLGVANKYVNKYHQILQEIKAIANRRFVTGLNEEADIYNVQMDRILNLITKAESEG